MDRATAGRLQAGEGKAVLVRQLSEEEVQELLAYQKKQRAADGHPHDDRGPVANQFTQRRGQRLTKQLDRRADARPMRAACRIDVGEEKLAVVRLQPALRSLSQLAVDAQ